MDKRRVSGVSYLLIGITPDAFKGALWRASAAWTYGFQLQSSINRRAASGVPFLPLSVSVLPDASKDVNWRMQVGNSLYFS